MAKVIKSGGEELGAITPDTGFAELSRKKPAIVSKEIYDAQGEAKKITVEAEQRAQGAMAQAQQKAEEIMARAKAEAEHIKVKAEEQGFKKGADDAAAKYVEMIAKHQKRLDQKEAEVSTQVRQLALAIAKKIVGKELEFHPDAVVEMAKKHLQSIRQRKEVYLRVCPQDLEVLREHKRDLIEQLGRAKDIELRSDEALTPGSMIIETDAGTIDARLETQMQVIERVLMGKGPV